jgi:glycosyltransferase involved in cell wall biosynthesis
MKIAFVSECFPSPEKPQYCIFLEQQAQALIALGNSVEIIVPKVGNIAYRKYARKGMIVYEFGIKGKWFNFFYKSYNKEIQNLNVDWGKYDVVSLHIISVPIAESVVGLCKRFQTKIVVHYHGLNVWYNYEEKKDIVHILLKEVEIRRKLKYLHEADAIVGVSESVCRIIRQKIIGNKVYKVYNGVDTLLFNQKKKKNGEEFCIVSVGNLIPIKGHYYLIESVKRLISKGIKVKLKIIGEGPCKQELINQSHINGIREKVEFAGPLSYDEVVEAMQNADMFVLPSYFESFGCVYLEAMSTGTVTLGCNCYGPSEIIENHKNGELINPKDSESICEAIEKVIRDKNYKKKLEENAVIRAKEFSWEASAKSLLAVYKKIV